MSDNEESKRDAQAIIDFARRFGEAELVSLGPKDPSLRVAALPTNRRLVSLKPFIDEYLPRPERLKGNAKLNTLDSFIAHLTRNADAATAVFADDGKHPSLYAVYDYHEPRTPETPRDQNLARWGEHRALYSFPLSTEWQAWTEHSGKELSQAQFAALLEDRITDVMPPDSASPKTKAMLDGLGMPLATATQLLTMSRGLRVHVESKVVNAQNLSSGEVSIMFEETHKSAQGELLNLQQAFVIGVPLFRGGGAYQVPVRLRYRVASQKILWTMLLSNVDTILQHAVKEAVDRVTKETGVPVFFGSPER